MPKHEQLCGCLKWFLQKEKKTEVLIPPPASVPPDGAAPPGPPAPDCRGRPHFPPPWGSGRLVSYSAVENPAGRQRDTCRRNVAGRGRSRSARFPQRLAQGTFPWELETTPSEPSWAKFWGPVRASATGEGDPAALLCT